MRSIVIVCLCLAWVTAQAQSIESKIGIHQIYIPKFTVDEASDSHVRALGLRWEFSDFNSIPFEFGFNAYAGYGKVAKLSYGINLTYLFARLNTHFFKMGLNLSRIEINDVEARPDEPGPHIGDVSFTNIGTEFKPYVEYEWIFSRYASLFAQAGYRIINGEKLAVTSVKPANDSTIGKRVNGRKESFFYSGSGFELGVGVSIQFFLK